MKPTPVVGRWAFPSAATPSPTNPRNRPHATAGRFHGRLFQKVGEAEVMVAGGVTDILLPYNIVGTTKANRLLRLAGRREESPLRLIR